MKWFDEWLGFLKNPGTWIMGSGISWFGMGQAPGIGLVVAGIIIMNWWYENND